MPKISCKLCKENVGTKRIRGFHVCSQCYYTYESLLHAVIVQPDNLYVKKALQRGDDKLDKYSSLGALTSYAAKHWQTDED